MLSYAGLRVPFRSADRLGVLNVLRRTRQSTETLLWYRSPVRSMARILDKDLRAHYAKRYLAPRPSLIAIMNSAMTRKDE